MHVAATIGVLEVEQVVQRPVQVVRDVRDLLVEHGRPRTSRFPQAAPGEIDGELVAAVGAGDPRVGVTVLVDATIKILQEREIGREQVLDDAGVDVVDVAECVITTRPISTTDR